MEIVTWVLEGSLVRRDSIGHNGLIHPGLAQRMSAGAGILHSEKNDSWRVAGDAHRDLVHFEQMWVVPDENNITPGYEQLEIDHELLAGGLVAVASGMGKHDGQSAIRIKSKFAALHAARLQPGQSVELPESPFLHLFVPRGTVTLEGAGDLATSPPETPSGSPLPAARRSPPSTQPRSSCGRCTPPSPPNRLREGAAGGERSRPAPAVTPACHLDALRRAPRQSRAAACRRRFAPSSPAGLPRTRSGHVRPPRGSASARRRRCGRWHRDVLAVIA
jgi:hypothetical protein